MATVREVLRQKGHVVHWIEPGASVRDAVRVMAERNIGAVAVVVLTVDYGRPPWIALSLAALLFLPVITRARPRPADDLS